MTARLDIRRFNMRSITFNPDEKKAPVIVFIGRRDTGKSFLVRDLLFHHQDIPIGTVISGTEMASPFFSEFVPRLFIHHEYNSLLIENILKRQVKILKQTENELKTQGRRLTDPRTFAILDDCLFDNKWAQDKLMRLLFMNGRHWKVMLIITMQYPLGVPPILRTNIDYVFILRENVQANRKRIYDNYASMFPTFELFCDILNQTTENYECLVINNNAKSNRLEDQVFYYRAEARPSFRMGAREFWDISRNLPQEGDEDELNISSSKKKPVKVNKIGNW
jgi:hypothetical protein